MTTSTQAPATATGGARTPRVPGFTDARIEILLSLFLPAALIFLMIFFALQTPAFLTIGNFRGIAVQNAATLVVAIPFALLLMSGGVDLSVGSTVALTGVVAGLLFTSGPIWLAVVAALAAGLAVGLINGVLISLAGMSPIIVTLGTLAVGRGIAQVLAPDPVFGFPAGIVALGTKSVLGVPYLVWITLVVTAIGMIVLNKLPVGRHIIGLGVNARAAFLVGLPVKRISLALYLTTSSGAAIAGVMLVARFNSAPSGTLGVGVELAVLTAVLLGGVPFTGGRGSLWRVVVGVLLLGVLRNGTTLLNVTPQISLIITGGVLILAAGLEIFRQRLSR